MKWIQKAAQIVCDKKGFNLLLLDVRGFSSITDYLLIAEGNINKHVTAIAQAILEEMQKQGKKPLQVEGMENGDWVVLDFPSFMIHIFSPGVRDRYQLERIWPESKLVELELSPSPDATYPEKSPS